MIDQEFVKYVVGYLVSKPDQVKVDREVDERGVLLTLHVADEDLGRVIGKKGSTAQSIRTLLRALGSKNSAHYNLRIADNDNHSHSNTTRSSEMPQEEAASPPPQSEEIPSEEAEDSLLDKTKKELKELDDLEF